MNATSRRKFHIALLASFIAILIWSVIRPKDMFTWFLESFPAMIAREFLLRKTPLQRGKLLAYLIVSICLAISAAYELLEFGVSMLTGSAGDAFLGTQGDIWDTQKDMLMALIGAITALLTLSRLHDHQLARFVDARSDRRAAG